MARTAAESPILMRAWSLIVVGLLLASLALGFLAFAGRVDPNLHGMVAFVTAAGAIASHVRRGSGWDSLAVVSLVVAVGLGLAARGGGAARPHLMVALAATVLSGGLHLSGWRVGER